MFSSALAASKISACGAGVAPTVIVFKSFETALVCADSLTDSLALSLVFVSAAFFPHPASARSDTKPNANNILFFIYYSSLNFIYNL